MKKQIYLSLLIILGSSNSLYAQAYPDNMNAYMSGNESTDDNNKKTAQANFFPTGRSSSNFFQNKSATPNMPGPERRVVFGTDVFHNPVNVPPQIPIAEPEKKEEEVVASETQVSDESQDESWSATKAEDSGQAKTLNDSIESESASLAQEPRVQEVLAQSKRIKEALFGKSNDNKPKGPKSTIASKTPPKEIKEIDRF